MLFPKREFLLLVPLISPLTTFIFGSRLHQAMVGGVLIPIGLFWFAL